MAKTFCFTRSIKLAWLDKVVELVLEGLTIKEIKTQLDEYLSYEVKDKTNIGKARNILIKIWADVDESNQGIRDTALLLYKKYPDCAIALHWGMMLLAYSIFSDLCRLVGRANELSDVITLKQIQNRLYDDWGESSTLYYSIQKLMSSLKNIGVLSSEKAGTYKVKIHKIECPDVVDFLLYIFMKIDGGSYYTFADLSSLTYMFPFEYTVSKEHLMLNKRFNVTTFDGQFAIALNAPSN